MITAIVSAIKGPMLSALSGCLVESGLANDSYFAAIYLASIFPRVCRATEKQACRACCRLLGGRLITHGLD